MAQRATYTTLPSDFCCFGYDRDMDALESVSETVFQFLASDRAYVYLVFRLVAWLRIEYLRKLVCQRQACLPN